MKINVKISACGCSRSSGRMKRKGKVIEGRRGIEERDEVDITGKFICNLDLWDVLRDV